MLLTHIHLFSVIKIKVYLPNNEQLYYLHLHISTITEIIELIYVRILVVNLTQYYIYYQPFRCLALYCVTIFTSIIQWISDININNDALALRLYGCIVKTLSLCFTLPITQTSFFLKVHEIWTVICLDFVTRQCFSYFRHFFKFSFKIYLPLLLNN